MRLETLLSIESFLPEIQNTHSGMFESRITILATSATMVAQFKALCHQIGVRCSAMTLASGKVHTRPSAVAVHRGRIEEAHEEVREIAERISRAGFTVVAIHIDASAPARSAWSAPANHI